ncbi:Ubiquitin-associated and SH3 domain-containing protein B [Bagarius yarrelli]|uniref:Ubiquitin-associated and SH3 domain-containing protein B n=1 Tax=Bagarius yarrelli TaxID=175774 RepID=A0A556TVA1_BAGYA|nr:Ubiquitin-associated and SH3 domain-containing protein B [Bagarius yarrelli]
MAEKEEQLYAKVTPRRQRQNRTGTLKHGSCLDVLLSMGFPKTRALFSHVDDPFLDDPLPREFVLYLRPSGPLLHQLTQFWQQSRVMCGKNKAHNIFPHITLCQFFMALCEALQTVVGQWRGRFPSPLPLELYISSNFIGLFVEEKVAEVLKNFAADFALEATGKADVHVEPHKKQLHVTLAYHFPTNHLSSLEKLARGVDVSLGCDWLAVLFSRDIRFANHESFRIADVSKSMLYEPSCLPHNYKYEKTLRVMYPYTPQNEDELELVPGDFIFMSPVEQGSASEGWVYGTSMGTGLSGLLPENYVSRADECDTWVLHGCHSFLNCTSPTVTSGAVGGPFFDRQLDGRLLEDNSLMEQHHMSVVCHPMQMLRTNSQPRLPKRTLFVCRHGERMDVVFGKHWITQCFDAKGRYIRSNLNMPSSLPGRSGGYREYDKDCPITVFGATQARLVGEALFESHTVINFVYCSPSLRCVQTAHNILRVEPGLFEWTKWVSGSSLPTWIPPTELAAANFSVDTTYRPHIPISKLTVSESYDTYIMRSFQVTREILAECKALGNTVLIVAHASSLEACTRQMQGLSPQNSKDFVQVVRKIPYLGFCACEEMGETGVWQLVDPPILPLTHGPNHSFNWRETLLQD